MCAVRISEVMLKESSDASAENINDKNKAAMTKILFSGGGFENRLTEVIQS